MDSVRPKGRWSCCQNHHGGVNAPVVDLFQLDVAGRSLDWLPLSVLSVVGCLFTMGVAAPLVLLFHGLLVIVWISVVHAILKISGGLASTEAGYEGTLRVVCYSQAAMTAAIIPWIGDEIAIVRSCILQVIGLVRLHRCTRKRAICAVWLPFAGASLALVLGIWLAQPEGNASSYPGGPPSFRQLSRSTSPRTSMRHA